MTTVRADLVAGATVTAFLIPQVMAYGELAGVSAVAGLWAAMAALAVYAVVGSSARLAVGPESTTALMTATAVAAVGTRAEPADVAAALALGVAACCFVGWLFRLSALADLLSKPVLVGYLAGVAVLMIVSQLGKLTGAAIEGDEPYQEVLWLLRNLDAVHMPTLLVGLGTLAALVVLAIVWPRGPVVLVGMLAATAAVALFDLQARGVAVTGDIPSGLPPFGLPDVDADQLGRLVGPALAVAFVAYSDNVLTGRSFANRHHERLDARRELLALGAVNLGTGLVQGFPVSSSGSRTAILDNAGAATRLAGVATLVVTVAAVLTLEPLLAAFPAAALAAVVVYAGLRLIDVVEFRRIAAFRRSEVVIGLATTASVVAIGVLQGVVVAVVLSVGDLLRRVARPHDAVLGVVPGMAGMHDVDDYPDATTVPGLMIYRYDSPLFFANAEDFADRSRGAIAASAEPVRWFLLNVEATVEVDITAVDVLEELRRELATRDIVMGLVRMKQDLRAELATSGLLERIGEDRVFPTLPTAVEAFRAWDQEPRP